jgi:hypothetical protein
MMRGDSPCPMISTVVELSRYVDWIATAFLNAVLIGMRLSEFYHCSYNILNLISSQPSDRDPITQI